ncbi:MAG: ATP-binding protein [Actinomycetota bacterium]|nr:ATP-binding protein [Actinomycetota bacterium]
MPAPLSLELAAVASELPIARHAITEFCASLGLRVELTEDIRLAVSEACTNVVLHAYEGHTGASAYALEARVEDGSLVVVVRDAGMGMPKDLVTRRSAGLGLGLPLMALMASSVDVAPVAGGGPRVAMRFAMVEHATRATSDGLGGVEAYRPKYPRPTLVAHQTSTDEIRECADRAHPDMADTDRPRWPMTPMSTGDPEAADPPRPSTVPRDDPPARGRPEAPASDDPPIQEPPKEPPRRSSHGPGGMDAIDEEPVREPDDDDAPGGMTGIPDPEDDRD